MRKNNKRALIVSALSLLLCVSMLVGTTFAWFTDNASTNVNKIEAGTLDIELLDGNNDKANSLEGKTLTFAKAADAPKDEAVLFEPGAKYSLTQVYLHNAGNLHAKYQVTITGIDGSSKLAEALDVYVAGENVGTLATLVANNGIVKTGTIAPKAYDTFGSIELMMQTTAGNEYQGLTMDGIAITVQATQVTVEYDSHNNTYDEDAEFDKLVVAGNQTELNDAIANAPAGEAVTVSLPEGTYKLPTISSAQQPVGKDITFTGSKDTVIDMTTGTTAANCDVTFDGVTISAGNGNYKGVQHSAKEVYINCTIKGTLFLYAADAEFVNCTFEMADNATEYSVWTYGAQDVNFSNCTFDTHGKAILVYNEMTDANFVANVSLEDCKFTSDKTVDKEKAVVETGSNADNTAASNKYNITINNCTESGFGVSPKGITTGSTLWSNKNSMDKNHLNVVINGVDVY